MKVSSSLNKGTAQSVYHWHQTTLDNFKPSKFGIKPIGNKKSPALKVFEKKFQKPHSSILTHTPLQKKITIQKPQTLLPFVSRIVPLVLTSLFAGLAIGMMMYSPIAACISIKNPIIHDKKPPDAQPNNKKSEEPHNDFLEVINNVESCT